MDSPTLETAKALSIINHPATCLDGPNLLHHLVQPCSKTEQDAIDFLGSDSCRTSLSYTELHHASETLARRISVLAGASESHEPFVVPVLLPQSPELYVALLAVLKAGGAFCPMNLDVPFSRAKFILEDVAARVVITTSELASKIPQGQHSLLMVDVGVSDEALVTVDTRKPVPSDLAYVMYTSGSTGTPKGVGVSHGAATQSLLAHDRHIPHFSRFLQFAAPTFDVSVFEIFFPLFRGMTLVSCNRRDMLNDLPGIIRSMNVDACELTPSVAGSLLRKRENAPCLRLLLTIGEMLTLPVVQEFGGKEGRPSMLWGMYGPTEAAIHCTVQPAFPCSSTVRNIGIPLDTVSAFVLKMPEENEETHDSVGILPRGEIGELALGGVQLAEGYLNRPEQTSTAFVDSSYGRLYRTGDKARMREDGTLECLGRIKDGQVKLRGQRMELGEVEHAALRTPGCHSAVATVTGATLVLFCAVDGDSELKGAILESCKQWLPGFMIPGDIVLVQNFPRLPSGKVDRMRLIADYTAQETGTTQAVTYRDGLEKQLCGLASSCLGFEPTPNQDLSKAGLDSLSAIKLASVLRDAGFEIGALDLLEQPTISAISKQVQSTTEAPGLKLKDLELGSLTVMPYNSALSAYNQPVEAILPCTPLQASMLFETTADPRAYCNWVELSIAGKHSIEDVRSWFSKLAHENEILRTGFIHHEGQFYQVVFEELPQPSTAVVASSDPPEFQIKDDSGFLAPFRIRFPLPQDGEDTTVVLQLHHAVYDGWSLDLIVSDLTRLARNQHLRPRPHFRQLLAYHQSAAFGRACDAAKEFWTGNLLGFQPPPSLPILYPETSNNPAVKLSNVSIAIAPSELGVTLKDINCGPQAVFQAALAWLWGSIIDTEDVVIGSIHSGRTLPIPMIENIIGPCIASVPLRIDLSQVRTIRDLLVSVHTRNRATLQHSVLPLFDIKRAAGVRPGHSLYDVLFIYQESLPSKEQAVDLVRQVAHQDYLETKLLFEVEPRDRNYECRMTYHSDTFPEPMAHVMQSLISALVLHMIQHLEAEISSLWASAPGQILSVFNQNPISFSGVPDLAMAVEHTAKDFPDRDAVCFANHISAGVLTTTSVTFAELNKTANQIAWHLKQHVREGDAVAIVMEKSIRLYAGIFAILKAGCAYLPLLPSTPIARIETILKQAEVGVCLVDTTTHDRLRQHLQCTFVDLESLDLRQANAPDISPPADPNRLAYIIYTSGSTGVPKGVCITQLNIMSNLDALSRIYPVKDDSRLLQSCSQAFDVSVFEIFFAWTQGMCLCSGTNDTLFEDLERSIRKLKVTHLSMTPTVASLADPARLPHVEFLVTAGEAMTETVARSWGDKLYQGYGPSETTNICSVKKMSPGQAIQHLGWSLENTSTFVLARGSLDVVPYGCLGEFCFGGDQVAAGYLKMPELTTEKFIDHPTYGRLYRSGDIGRMLPDGSMVIVGRADELIKIRGQRVELKEITEAIRQTGVVDCATLLLEAEETGNRAQIVSFSVPAALESTKFHVLDLDADEIKKVIQSIHHILASRLPTYMLPSAIIPISMLPVTASGKLDRAQLKQVYRDMDKDRLAIVTQGPSQDEADGDWSSSEMQIAEAICSALNVDRADIQRWTPLVVFGLDSISAIEVSRHLEKTLGIRYPISTILQNPSVARLARALSHADGKIQRPREMPELLPRDTADNIATRLAQLGKSFSKLLPCTPLQQAMLVASSGKGQYLNHMLFKINGELERLRTAWDAMVVRHDILRTCFVETDSSKWPILQVVLDSWQAPWKLFDASQASLEQCISEHLKGVPNAMGSLEPAVSFAIIEQADRVYLSVVCHHALYDGIAVERLMYEVEQEFLGFILPSPPPYDQFLHESLNLPVSTDSFWLEHLRDYEPRLATHLVSEAANTSQISPLDAELDMPLGQLKKKIRELGVSLLALTQAAWSTVLVYILETDDVCFGNVVNGRSLPIDGINELVAPCFNTIPIRVDLSRKQTNLELLKTFQAINTEMIEYQFTPLRRIQSLYPQHGTRRLFDTLLLLQQSPRLLDRTIWTLERDDGEMDFPLVCEVIPDAQLDRLVVRMHTEESHSLPGELVGLACDLFLYALQSCLRFPGSYGIHDSPSTKLKERLSRVKYRPPLPTSTEVPVETTVEEWSATENTVQSVLTSLAPRTSKNLRRDTTIYQLGLDSISAVQIASLLRRQGHHVAASDVLDHPTISDLARHIDAGRPDKEVTTAYNIARFRVHVEQQVLAHGIARNTIEALLPCTPLQSGMMAQFIKSGGRDYFIHIHFVLDQRVNAATIVGAWQAVAQIHPILRTSFVSVEHDDCMFAMVQHYAAAWGRNTNNIIRSSPDEFDVHRWRLDTSQAALRHPHTRLWNVAIVESNERVEMHLAIHHAVFDAQSLQHILDDLAKALMGHSLYEGSPIQGAVADILGHASFSGNSVEFWKQQAKHVVINKFPILTPLQETPRRIMIESVTSTAPLRALEDAASKAGYTLQAILQAAWTRILSAYLGEDSVVFGVVLSGRNTEATRNAVFPCITTLPVVATNTNSNETLLTQMQRYSTELYKQQHQPLTRIQQWLGCPDSRLFDTLLVYQKFPRDISSERPWRVLGESANVDYPVSIEVEPRLDGHLAYHITFFSDVVASEQALLLLKQLDATVQHLSLQPLARDTDLFNFHTDLFSISPPEIPQIATEVQFLHQFVERQALRTPDAVALQFVERFEGGVPVEHAWTYKELNDKGDRVAHMLLPHSQPGDFVAVLFEKCPEAYFSILGILKAGCAFVALDPAAPRARNEFILRDSGASALVTSKGMKGQVELDATLPTLVIDQHSLCSAAGGPPTLGRELRPTDVCYCLYTSGTTGTPKGCEITHDNAVQCMLAFQHIFRGHWKEDSKWLQFASLHFDVSVLEQYWSWSVGITLVGAPRDLILEDLAGTISRLQITHIDLTPSLARLLHPDDVPSLCKGVFITGGESLKQEILDAWGSKRVIYNFYGPTEATIGVTVFPRVPVSGRASNIGQQFINVGSYVLKPGTQHPVLRGGVGELCVSGRLVGKGYLHREDLTVEKFPVLEHFGERVYRTGDLVRILHDGCFDFLGRADDQVKLRGQRLEIGEINHAIRKGVDEVHDVATLVVRNEAQKKDVLVSFIAANDGNKRKGVRATLEVLDSPEAAELCQRSREACRSKLPSYMVPTYVLQIPFIPLSLNNKAELKQLKQLFASLEPERLVSLSSSPGTSRRELSETGARIARVIAATQKLDESLVIPDSTVFDLGVDSISVLRLSRALKNEGFTQASPALILRHPQVSDLVAALIKPLSNTLSQSVANARQLIQACAHKHRPLVCRELSLTPNQIDYIAPCSPLQQGMISRSATDSAYFNSFEFVLSPNVSTGLLRGALQKTIDTLPILRTKFVATTDGVVQVAVNRLTLPWTDIQLNTGETTTNTVHKSRDAWIMRNQQNIFQPLEAVLVRGEEGGRSLVLHIFHALYDANSFNLIVDRVVTEYSALADPLAARTDFTPDSSFFEALCHGPLQDFSNSRPFWVEHLKGVIPIASHSSTTSSVVSTQRRIRFEHLESLRTRLGVTHQALLQAAWLAALAKHRSTDPTIGVIVSGRSIDMEGTEMVVGPLFNTLPFHARLNTEGNTSWASLVRQCHEFNTAVLPFQHVSLRDIQKWCSGGRPLFDTLFSFQREEQHLVTDRENLWTVKDSQPNADYPLALEAILTFDGYLRMLIVAQLENAQVEALMGDLQEALESMMNGADRLLWNQDTDPTLQAAMNGTSASSLSNSVLNGNHSASSASKPRFTWTAEALTIRREMASLADTDPDSITETTPLFGLGLDSIDVIKLAAVLKKHKIEIKTSELMRSQTIEAIMEVLHVGSNHVNQTGAIDTSCSNEISQVSATLRQHIDGNTGLADDELLLPATPLQESMVLGMIDSEFQLYFNHDILEIGPSVDITRLKDAWRVVIAGSPILRTRFLPVESPSIKSSFCQAISNSSSIYMTEVNLDSTDELAKVCQTATLRARKGAGRSNLLQLAFATVAAGQRYLVLSIAHALYDGWSLGVLHRHVQSAYCGEYQPHDLVSYTRNLQNLLFPENRDAPSFWSGFLQGARPTLLPKDVTTTEQAPPVHRDEVFSSASVSSVAAFCKANAVTLQTLGQACWSALLAARTGSMDVTFGVVLACRDDEALEKLLFPTMNTVAVRNILHGTISSWLRYMQENMSNIASYQHFALRDAQRLAGSNGPLFNTLFIQQRGLPGLAEGEGDDPLMRSVGGTSAVEYPVCVEMETMGPRLIWRVACDGAYASREKTSQLLKDLDELLDRMIRSPEANVLEFSGPQVSICGQPFVVLQAQKESTPVAAATEAAVISDYWSPSEEIIRGVLAEVSGVSAATILKSNTIYHLGLDSISAIKAASLLKKNGLTIGLRDMLKAGSISQMARVARAAHLATTIPEKTDGGDRPKGGLVIPPGFAIETALGSIGFDFSMTEGVLPATSMQVHMLSVWQNTHGEVFYPCFQYTMSGQIDAPAIARAWRTLRTETPILRTIFISTESRSSPILQVIIRPSAFNDAEHSLSAQSCSWSSAATEQYSQPYSSLSAEKQGDRWLLRLKLHHALYDAVSLPAIMNKFGALCGAQNAEQPANPPGSWPSTILLRDSEENAAARHQFWTEYLAGVAPFKLLQICQEEEGMSKSRVGFVKPAAFARISSLLERCKAQGVSFQALFFAAYAEFLASVAIKQGLPRPETVVFGIYIANRVAHDELGASVYPFLRLVPLRVVLRPSLSNLFDIAADIQADIHNISSPVNVEVGLWEIKDWTGVTVDSFVNFLAAPALMPASAALDGDVEKKGEGVLLELVNEQVVDNSPFFEYSNGVFDEQLARGLASNPVRGAFPDAVDVEISMQNDEITVGVFGSGQKLGSDGPAMIIEEIRGILAEAL